MKDFEVKYRCDPLAKEATTMPHAKYSHAEIGDRGEKLYERSLRSLVETEENIGKIINIDIETGDYEIDADLIASGRRLQARHPDAAMYGKRIGYNAVYGVGGAISRTEP
jgi:hypothetical protein